MNLIELWLKSLIDKSNTIKLYVIPGDLHKYFMRKKLFQHKEYAIAFISKKNLSLYRVMKNIKISAELLLKMMKSVL